VEGRRKKKFKKNGNSPTGLGVAPRLVTSCLHFFQIFLFKKKNFWKFEKWARAFGRMGVQHPNFLKLAPTFGSANSSKIHGEWRFHFFPKKINPKFRSHMDFHIYYWDFCFMKK
jgi:hypothetical protein